MCVEPWDTIVLQLCLQQLSPAAVAVAGAGAALDTVCLLQFPGYDDAEKIVESRCRYFFSGIILGLCQVQNNGCSSKNINNVILSERQR